MTNPWEARGGRGLLAAFGETLQEALLRPTALFRGTGTAGAARALWFAAAAGTLGFVGSALWEQALGELPLPRWGRHVAIRGVGLAALAVVLPAAMAAASVLWAGVLHVSLLLAGAASGGYRATLKAVCYASSANVLAVFPIFGGVVGGVWQVALQVIGLREMHGTTTARAVWALLMPVLFLAFMAAAAAVLALAGLAHLWQRLGAGFEL